MPLIPGDIVRVGSMKPIYRDAPSECDEDYLGMIAMVCHANDWNEVSLCLETGLVERSYSLLMLVQAGDEPIGECSWFPESRLTLIDGIGGDTVRDHFRKNAHAITSPKGRDG